MPNSCKSGLVGSESRSSSRRRLPGRQQRASVLRVGATVAAGSGDRSQQAEEQRLDRGRWPARTSTSRNSVANIARPAEAGPLLGLRLPTMEPYAELEFAALQ